jgi:plasmid stabilization system protein ParE
VKIVIAPLAAHDLQEAYDFIAKDNKRAADEVQKGILEVENDLDLQSEAKSALHQIARDE